jgi:hypothetical protein
MRTNAMSGPVATASPCLDSDMAERFRGGCAHAFLRIVQALDQLSHRPRIAGSTTVLRGRLANSRIIIRQVS